MRTSKKYACKNYSNFHLLKGSFFEFTRFRLGKLSRYVEINHAQTEGNLMKMFSSLALSALALLASPAVHADTNSNCVPQSEMAEIAKSFPQFQQYASKEYCYDGGQDSHLIAGIVFMRSTQFDKNMVRSGDELFSGKFASSWWNYFIGRINQFEVDDSCPKGVVAYVFAFGGKTMYACSAALTDQFTPLDLASVFMHEARHIDGYPHITCSHGPRQIGRAHV